MIYSVDCGRSSLKLVCATKMFHFPAYIGEWRERKLKSTYGGEIELEYEGEKYFVGDLAKNESEFVRSMMTDSKAHEDTLLLVLTALHKAGASGSVKVMTGLPVDQHTDEEKEKLKTLLKGDHVVKVNGIEREINIDRVEVAIEGGAAFWSNPLPGKVRILDAGSKTVNYLTMQNKRYVDRESGTLPFGFDTNKSNDIKQISNRIAGEVSKKWKSNDKVLLVGGKAKELQHHMSRYFQDMEVAPNHLYANAKGFYKIGTTLL
jgi:plasmid segregation protein ParM